MRRLQVFHCADRAGYFNYILSWWLFEPVFSAIKIMVFVSYVCNVHGKKLSFKWADERAPLPDYPCEWLHNLPSPIERRDCLVSDTFTNKGLIFFHLAQYEISTFYDIFVYSFVGTLVQIFVWTSQLYPFPHFFLGAFIFFFLMWQASI